jgi:hypothetical protein
MDPDCVLKDDEESSDYILIPLSLYVHYKIAHNVQQDSWGSKVTLFPSFFS